MASSHKVDIGGLLAGGRQHLSVQQQVALEPFEGVRFPQPAQVQLDVHASGDMLEITGSVDVKIHSECGRCLGDVERAMHVDVDEQLDVGPQAQADPFGTSNVLRGDRLDVKDLATQVVVSAIPLGLLCGEDCRGICPTCGENKNSGACTCTEQTTGDE
ncbi:MAG TPA: DUF177 domain-containing protein [Candidatus Baltobacteraceae bacterium]|jgi:uncharacterized protein|nr:DUF177 domain-containing protein [Candidatus Baltobacteraceae bacterium]